jgi:hypothetical protein
VFKLSLRALCRDAQHGRDAGRREGGRWRGPSSKATTGIAPKG